MFEKVPVGVRSFGRGKSPIASASALGETRLGSARLGSSRLGAGVGRPGRKFLSAELQVGGGEAPPVLRRLFPSRGWRGGARRLRAPRSFAEGELGAGGCEPYSLSRLLGLVRISLASLQVCLAALSRAEWGLP